MPAVSGAASTVVRLPSGSRTKRWLPLLVLVGLLLATPAALADENVHQRNVTAHDDAGPCVKDTAPCFAIEAAHGLVEDTDRLTITFTNNGTQPHSLLLASAEAADPENGTPTDEAFLTLGPIDPGETVEATTEIPDGIAWIHLFCDVGDHEEQGMHETRNVYPGGSVQEAENQTIGDPPEERIPSSAAATIAAIAAGAALGVAGRVDRRDR